MTPRHRTPPRTPAAPGAGSAALLTGPAWGLVAVVLVAVAVFAAMLVSDGRERAATPAAPPSTASPADPGWPSAVAGWSLDEGTGPSAAAAGPERAGAELVRRPGADWTAGRTGTGLQLDGTRGYAATEGPVLDTAGSYTVAAWVRLDRIAGYMTAVSQDGASYSAFYLQYSADVGRYTFSLLAPGDEATVRAVAVDPPVLGRWQHLVGVRDAATGAATLYVDGARQGTADFPQRVPSAGPLAVGRGRFRAADVDFWPGAVDAVHAYASALGADQVRTLYLTGR